MSLSLSYACILYLARLSDPDRTQAPADSLRLPVLSSNIHESAIVPVTNTPASYHVSTYPAGPSSPNFQLVPKQRLESLRKENEEQRSCSSIRSAAPGLPIS